MTEKKHDVGQINKYYVYYHVSNKCVGNGKNLFLNKIILKTTLDKLFYLKVCINCS